MKKILSLLIVCMISITAAAQLSEADRTFAVNYLMATHQNIVETVSDLDDDAFNWKPADGGWSVANSFEHILTTEAAFHGMVQGGVANNDADPELDKAMADGMLLSMMSDRGTRVTTIPNFEPSGKWTTKAEMLSALEESRTMLAEYLQNTDDDLRHYKMEIPIGELDGYQIYLLIASHSYRHTSQMKEALAEMAESM